MRGRERNRGERHRERGIEKQTQSRGSEREREGDREAVSKCWAIRTHVHIE